MAPKSLPALLVVLTLAATLAPAPTGGAQTNASGAIALSTAAAAYPPGGAVLFTLNNSAGAHAVTPTEFQVFAQAQLVAAFTPGIGTVAGGARGAFNWSAFVNGSPAPLGDYWGVLKYVEHQEYCNYSGSCSTVNFTKSLYVNGKQFGSAEPAWVIKDLGNATANLTAQGRLAVKVEPSTAQLGQTIAITLTNVGTAPLNASTPCQVGFSVRAKDSATVLHSTLSSGPCIQVVATLEVGASLNLTWDQNTSSGMAKPGEYRVQGHFGSASSAEASLVIAAPSLPPPPPPANGTRPAVSIHANTLLAAQGTAFQFQLVNTGDTDLEGGLTVRVKDANGTVIFAPASLQILHRLKVGGTLDFRWAQGDDRGQQVPPGKYQVVATFGALEASAFVEVVAKSATPPPPPASEPAPEKPPEKPVVGRIDIVAETSASGAQCYQGDWVSFCLDGQARVLRDFTADGRRVIRALALPGSGGISVHAMDGALVLKTTGAVVTVFDSPAGSLQLTSSAGASGLQLTLAESLSATVGQGNATLRGGGFEALLLVKGQGNVSGGAQDLRIDLAPDARGEAGLVLRAVPLEVKATAPAPSVQLTDAVQVKAALQAALPQAIAAQKVAAEAYIAKEGTAVKTSVVPYIAANVVVEVQKADPAELTMTVDVSEPHGRTLVFHVGEGVLVDTRAGFRVLYDGAPIGLADSLADVLDPDDDGLAAEYVLVESSAGVDLVMSIPHFSVHTISVQSLAQVLPSLAPYGAVAGFALMAVAAVYLLRRAKD